MYASKHGITFDDELLYVSAMLHDIGLTDVFDSHRVAFEEAGGYLAWVFGVAAGWLAQARGPTSPTSLFRATASRRSARPVSPLRRMRSQSTPQAS